VPVIEVALQPSAADGVWSGPTAGAAGPSLITDHDCVTDEY
jgi:hypothetical protein